MKFDPYSTIINPVITENAITLIESENKLVFMIDRKATKNDVKRAVEALYEVEVEKINVMITSLGKKKAFVKLNPRFKASDVAIKLGIF
jgi:large subunit ribosomal protein L23